MPGTSRDLKRRRAPAEDSPSTPSKRARTHIASPSPLAKRSAKRNAAVDDPFNTDASRSPKKRSTSQRVNGTPSKNYSHHTPRKPSGLRTNARLVDIISDELEEEETSGVSDDEKDEPRRSSRLRKPTAEGAKLLLKGKPSARAPHTLPAKKAAKLPFSPSKSGPPPRDVQSSPAPVRRLRGRTPKARNAAQSTPIREKSESKPNAAASDTSRKSRGRPVRRVLSLGNLKNDDLQADETPDATPKPKQGRARKPKDLCSSDDLVDVLVNDQLPKDIEMKDVVTPKNSKRTETLGRATYSSLVDIVLQKLCQRRPVPLTGLEDEYAKVYKLVEATVVAGEGNSMLVIGARGTGKTALVDNVLATLSKSERDNFHTIRLNGFVQTDDKLALREIWRQLGREMEIDEEGGKSYADTLIMLLAILSHPEEISGQTGDQVAKSVIFVLEEFDLFATHARQTLLYNLLDIAQSRKAPIAILGLTTKFDVTESLEKRVKSRFSHRYVHLPLPKSLGSFHDICKAACSIEPSELTFEEKALVAGERKSSKPNSKRDSTNFLDIWNSAVENLFSDPSFNSRYIRPTYHLTKSVPSVLGSLILPFATLLDAHAPIAPILPPAHFQRAAPALQLQPPPSTLPLTLPHLSDLQLALLIACARLAVVHASDACSFAMAYEEYVSLASRARLQQPGAARVWGRDVARGEWEALLDVGLVVPVAERAGVAGAVAAGALVRVDVALEEIPGWVPDISATMEKWCRQI